VSTLVAVAYPDLATAEQVRGVMIEASKEHLADLQDAVIVEREQGGKVKLHQVTAGAGAGAAGGALWGGLIGLLFLAPLFGMAVGAASGALGGKMADLGVDDDFVKSLGERLPPGAAALIVLGESGAGDKLIERVQPYGGEVLQTSLSNEAEAHLRDALGARAAA
jgi:uncharacterized membrane protein